jgi:hypothetical protein
MRRWIAWGTVALLTCVPSASAQDRADRPDRSLRLDHDSMRNDYREDRLKVPAHPLFEQQAQPVAPVTPKGKSSSRSKRSGEASR